MVFDRLFRGWALTKASLNILRLDTEILLLPVVSGILMVLLAVASFGPLALLAFQGAEIDTWMIVVAYLVVHFLGYFVIIYFNAAVVHMATMRFEGHDPTVKDGLRKSRERVGLIFQWALLAATVGLLLHILQNALRQRGGFLGAILGNILQFAWSAIVYFVVPLVVYRGLTPIQAVKESSGIIRRTWGEAIGGEISMGLVFMALGFLGFVVLLAGLFLGGGLIALGIAVIVVLYWLVLAVMYSATQGILTAALYKFATTGQVPQGFQGGQLQQAIR